MRATERTFERIRDAFEKVAKDEAERIEHRARNVEEYGFPAASHRARRRTRRCHDVVSVLKLQQFSLGRLHVVGKNKIGEGPTGYWWYQQVTVPVRQRCSKRMRCCKECVKT